NFIDTADVYQKGQSESMIAKTLAPYRTGLVIATKGGMSWQDSSAINDPSYLRNALDASLKRLKHDRIDLYQLHRTDPKTPIEQTAAVLKEMQDRGKVRYIGLSEVTVEQIEQYRAVVEIVSVQNQYNILERKHEAVLEYCEANGRAFIPRFPHAKSRLGNDTIERVASNHNASQTQIALAWLLMRSPSLLPIPGTLSTQHLESNLASARIELTGDEFEELSEIVMVARQAAA
ncbi:MAG: aldo/keto reductase, partial [Candidatus Kapaibacterium sp.]